MVIIQFTVDVYSLVDCFTPLNGDCYTAIASYYSAKICRLLKALSDFNSRIEISSPAVCADPHNCMTASLLSLTCAKLPHCTVIG